jgi:hypothetical protein
VVNPVPPIGNRDWINEEIFISIERIPRPEGPIKIAKTLILTIEVAIFINDETDSFENDFNSSFI